MLHFHDSSMCTVWFLNMYSLVVTDLWWCVPGLAAFILVSSGINWHLLQALSSHQESSLKKWWCRKLQRSTFRVGAYQDFGMVRGQHCGIQRFWGWGRERSDGQVIFLGCEQQRSPCLWLFVHVTCVCLTRSVFWLEHLQSFHATEATDSWRPQEGKCVSIQRGRDHKYGGAGSGGDGNPGGVCNEWTAI